MILGRNVPIMAKIVVLDRTQKSILARLRSKPELTALLQTDLWLFFEYYMLNFLGRI